MESPALGIDLGTTNSVVAVADGKQARVLADAEGRRLIPSAVSFHPDGSILVGHDARERRLVDAPNTVYSIKRLIGRPFDSPEVQRAKERLAFPLEASPSGGVQVRVRRGTFALPEISAMVLRHLRTIAETALGTTCKQAVITVPANFNDLQRSATQAAGKVAGLDVLRVINEPTAATLAHGYGKDKPETVAVYDFGGGTFDLTILDLDKEVFEVVSTAGDTFLGGDDVDVLIADRMCAQCLAEHRYDPHADPQTYERLRAAAEWAKCQLSAVADVDLTLEELFQDASGRTIDFQFHLTRADLDQMAKPLIARSFDVVADAMRAAGRRPKEIDSVVLVGGTTRMPLVREMVAEHFGRAPRVDIDPDLVVAQGAAIHAFTLRKQTPRAADPTAVAKALALAAKKPPAIPPPKGALGVRVPPPPPRKQPAFAPEHPADRPPAPPRPAAVPRPGDVDHGLATPEAAADEATRIAPAPERAARGGTSPLGLAPAARIAPPAGLDDGLEDEGTLIARRPSVPAPDVPDLSTPFLEPPPAVAVVQSRAIGVGSGPLPSTPRSDALGLMELDPVEAPPPRRPTHDPSPPLAAAAPPRPPREPTLRIGTGPAARPIDTGPIRPPTGAGMRVPTGTWGPAADPTGALEPVDPLPAVPAPPTPHDREKIQQALFGGKPKPFGGMDAPPPPPPPRHAPEPESRPDLSWSDFQISMPPPEPAMPLAPPSDPFGVPDALPLPSAQPSAQAVAPRQAVVVMSAGPVPLLMDVTPLALGLETAGGYAQQIVARNAPVPTEKTRVFSTGKDGQTEVEVRICQGDSNVFAQNQTLGAVTLSSLRRAARGQVRIEVTFMIDASGMLDVKATDLDTKRVEAIRIALKGGASEDEVLAMQRRQAELFPNG